MLQYVTNKLAHFFKEMKWSHNCFPFHKRMFNMLPLYSNLNKEEKGNYLDWCEKWQTKCLVVLIKISPTL